MVRLQIDPELRSRTQSAGQESGGFRSHTALPAHELVDPLDWDTQVLSKCHLADAQRLEELLEENLAGVGRDPILGQHPYSSVVVIDLDIMRISVFPTEHDPPLVVDADVVLPSGR